MARYNAKSEPWPLGASSRICGARLTQEFDRPRWDYSNATQCCSCATYGRSHWPPRTVECPPLEVSNEFPSNSSKTANSSVDGLVRGALACGLHGHVKAGRSRLTSPGAATPPPCAAVHGRAPWRDPFRLRWLPVMDRPGTLSAEVSTDRQLPNAVGRSRAVRTIGAPVYPGREVAGRAQRTSTRTACHRPLR